MNEEQQGCALPLLMLAGLGAVVFLLITSASIHQGAEPVQAMETGSSAGAGIIILAILITGVLFAILWNAAKSDS